MIFVALQVVQANVTTVFIRILSFRSTFPKQSNTTYLVQRTYFTLLVVWVQLQTNLFDLCVIVSLNLTWQRIAGLIDCQITLIHSSYGSAVA